MTDVLFTACDAGTANFLLPVLPRLALPHAVLAQGRAAEIFTASGIPFEPVETCPWEALEGQGQSLLDAHPAKRLIAGTSWGASVDKALTLAARKRGVESAAIVEHWNLYRERFSRVEQGLVKEAYLYLPGRVWVNDSYAVEDAVAAGLPRNQLLAVGQPYLERQLLELRKIPAAKPSATVLFVSERLREDYAAQSSLGAGFDEYDALDALLGAMDFTKQELVIKLHPQEEQGKYDAVLARPGVRGSAVKHCELNRLLVQADKIVGIGSMLLLEAALVRPDVISFMPRGSADGFIGNRIGATTFISSPADLRTALARPRPAAAAPSFGNRFLGSTENVLNIIRSDLP